MNNYIEKDVSSPFDGIKHARPNGTEYWSARELMPLLGYDKWGNFERCINEARKAASIAAAQDQFADSSKMVEVGSGAQRPVFDVEMTRYGAYMTAMSCDGRKPEVAAAKTYFAVQTHRAETQQPAVNGAALTRMELIDIARNAEMERLALQAKTEADAPKAEAYEAFMDADGKYNIGEVGKMFGIGQVKMFRLMRNAGILQAKGHMHNTPYQKYMHHFEVVATERKLRNGETVTDRVTYVQPSGIDFIRKKLGLGSIDPGPQQLALQA